MNFEKLFVSEQILDWPREKVFGFFSDARNLQNITPPLLDFTILSKLPIEMKSGTLIDYRLKVHGLPIRWTSEILNWNPPNSFVEVQLRGPYALWHHTHEFVALDADKTLIKDTVRYKVPFGPLGLIAEKFFVRKDIEKIFEYRRAQIAQLLEGWVGQN